MNIFPLQDIVLLLLGFAVLAVDLFSRNRAASFHTAWLGLAVVSLIICLQPHDRETLYLGTYLVDGFSLLFKQFFTLSALLTLLLARSYFTGRGDQKGPLANSGEFSVIIIFCTFGMFTVVSSRDLLTLFIGMELATIPLYVLSGFRKGDDQGAEAATKYIVMGSLSTCIGLFGYSFLYGRAGALTFDAVATYTASNTGDPLLHLGVVLILVATGFKLTLVPFHMWAPDVYEGAPTPVTAFLSVSSKATAVAFLLILFFGPLAPAVPNLQNMLLLLAGVTMTVGNLGAMRQNNLRRFMAYSSIAQAGYIVMALAGQAQLAKGAILYYLPVYAAANFAVFFIIAIVGRERGENFAALRGLGKQHPGLAAILMLCMFSLAGIPPLAGFTGKFMLFAAAAKQGFYGMVLFAALNSTVSLYYYLLIIKEAYIKEPENELGALEISLAQKSSLLPLTLAMLLLGVLPMLTTAIMGI